MSEDRFKHGRQHKSKPGTGLFVYSLLGLVNEPTQVKAKKERVRRGGKVLLTDDQVREARRLHEKECFTIEMVAGQFGLGREYTRNLLNYTVRSKVR